VVWCTASCPLSTYRRPTLCALGPLPPGLRARRPALIPMGRCALSSEVAARRVTGELRKQGPRDARRDPAPKGDYGGRGRPGLAGIGRRYRPGSALFLQRIRPIATAQANHLGSNLRGTQTRRGISISGGDATPAVIGQRQDLGTLGRVQPTCHGLPR
jgi:hypothetical protein